MKKMLGSCQILKHPLYIGDPIFDDLPKILCIILFHFGRGNALVMSNNDKRLGNFQKNE